MSFTSFLLDLIHMNVRTHVRTRMCCPYPLNESTICFQIEDPADVAAAVEEDEVEKSFRVVTSRPTVPPVVEEAAEDDLGEVGITEEAADGGGAVGTDRQESGTAAENVWMQQEGLAFVAGYVASACQTIDPTLGLPTDEAPPSRVPQRWIRAVSRGGLTVPSESWMSVVESFEVLFGITMGSSVDRDPGVVRRLIELLREKEPGLDIRIARKLVRTRLHIRLRFLNQELVDAAADRRAAKQVRQHVRSSL